MSATSYSLGFRIKSGHAIAVALEPPADSPRPLGRFVIALSDPKVDETKQPFHNGFGTAQEDARVIRRLTTIVARCAAASIEALLKDERLAGRRCRGAALVVGSVIDPARVGNPHIRAHASEGRLFRTVVEEALRAHGIDVRIVVEKAMGAAAAKAIGQSDARLKTTIGTVGRALGAPWRGEEKAAATAAWMILASPSS